MKHTVHIRRLDELFPEACRANGVRERIHCETLDAERIAAQFSTPLFLHAAVALFVLSGTAEAVVNYKPQPVAPHALLLLSASHVFHFSACSPDFRCAGLFVSKEFMDERDSTDMIYRRIKYGVRMYARPVVMLAPPQADLLLARLSALDQMIDNRDHLYQKDMILNHLLAFYLDLSNILDRHTDLDRESNLTRYESLIKSFIELLVVHYRSEHKVDFYASRLNVSAHYLTLIVKRITGRSVSDFIFEMLYSEARNLLTHSRLSVQEIAAALHFSDQSAFGKFFYRKAGKSPVEYRRET